MLDIETRMEYLLGIAQTATEKGNRALWARAWAAHQVVGLNLEGATREFAARCGVGVDMVEKYAHAYRTYRQVCGMHPMPCGDGKFRYQYQIRRLLSVGHYHTLYDLAQRHGMTQFEQGQTLALCIQPDDRRYSIKDMSMEVESVHGNGKAVEWRAYYLPRIKKIAGYMLTFPDLPNDLSDALKVVYGYE